jgi:hypothetical protein
LKVIHHQGSLDLLLLSLTLLRCLFSLLRIPTATSHVVASGGSLLHKCLSGRASEGATRLNYVEDVVCCVGEAAGLTRSVPALGGDLSVDLTHIFIARDGEVPRLNEGPVDVLALDFPHFLFVLDPEILADEFGVYGDYLYDLVPQLEYLTANLVKVLHELESNLVWVTQVHPLRKRYNLSG